MILVGFTFIKAKCKKQFENNCNSDAYRNEVYDWEAPNSGGTTLLMFLRFHKRLGIGVAE